MRSVLILEPYAGDSHLQLVNGMQRWLPLSFRVLTMPARKWKWRMRGAALYFADLLASAKPAEVLFCSSVLSLTDLLALGPSWLRDARKVVYFHENQFVYPRRLYKEWDFHFALTNLTTALAADVVVFNSRFNRDSMLEAVPKLLKKFPDFRPHGAEERIAEKSHVLPVPLDPGDFPHRQPKQGPACIVWNHRWEHDKDPEAFFTAMFALQRRGVPFTLCVLGQQFKECLEVFAKAREKLAAQIVHWGYAESRTEYLRVLAKGDIVVSTALQEFFGVAVLEAVRAGCFPLVPNRLVYPELYPAACLYEEGTLVDKLAWASEHVAELRTQDFSCLARPFDWPYWVSAYCDVLQGS
ncbi:MAG: tRNA-queuosine alpha-mannosyltransferase domain-containing protein [Candidatus Oleimicrobiaceae bacterium]